MLKRYLSRQQPAPRALVGGFDEYDFCEIPSEIEVSAASQALQTALANENTERVAVVQVPSDCKPETEGFQVAEDKLEPEHVGSCSTRSVEDLPHASAAPETSDSPTLREAEALTMGNATQTENENSGAAPTTSAASPVPSQEELDAAARALQAMNNQSPKNVAVASTSAQTPRVNAFLASRPNNAVAYCLDLFQRDPQVQAAVVSLARDPAVWDAFINNEKVQELLKNQSKSKRSLLIEGHPVEFLRHSSASNPFFVAFQCLMSTLWGLMDSLVEVVHGVFGFFDKKLFGGNDPTDHPVKATMVLTILLLALILVSR